MEIYDLIIIGAGPAGITASVYAARKKLNFLVVSIDIGGQAAWSGDIENYTGYQFITGPDLTQKFQEHMRKYNIALKENEEVRELKKLSDIFTIKTTKADYQARSVIIASGKMSKELGITGEDKFKNRGLSYCATCDAPLFTDKIVAVIGGGNSALDAVLQLDKIARQIYLINNTEALGGDMIMRQKVNASSKVTVLNNVKVTSVFGDKFVSGIEIVNNHRPEKLAVSGVFVEAGLVPNSKFVQDVKRNAKNEIEIDLNNQTSIAGLFACGDVTNISQKQIIIAAGEGAKAALNVFRYLAQHVFA